MHTKQSTLFRRDFTLVVVGQVISLFGSAILRFALPLYLLRRTNSAELFGAVGAAAAASATAVYSRRAFYELDADGCGEQNHA